MSVITLEREKVLARFLELKEVLEKRNAEGIEKYRKGNFTLKFPNAKNQKISVKQIKHKFLFGSTAFMLRSFENLEKERIYKEHFVKLFNQAVVPFYWSDLEPQEGNVRFSKESENIYRRPAPDIVLGFCEEYGLEPKGHCLLWNSHVPQWLQEYSEEKRKEIVERRFKQIAENYANQIPSFDIINESASNYNFGKKELFEKYDEFALELGEKYFSKNIKILNETNKAIWVIAAHHKDDDIRIIGHAFLIVRQRSVRLIGIILHGPSTDTVAIHMVVITQQILQQYGIIVLGPVFDAMTIGNAVANAGNLNLSTFCFGSIAHARQTVEIEINKATT